MRTRIQSELPLGIEADRSGPIHLQIERGLRDAIQSGRLRPASALPSTRTLARDLQVSRGVIVEAYEQLIAEGYLEARTRASTVVAGGGGRTQRGSRQSAAATPRFDFRPGLPDLSFFPRAQWMAAMRRAFRTLRSADLSYGPAEGAPILREQLSEYLARIRGVDAKPENILIASGFTQAFALTLQVLRSRGLTRLALEDPCHPELRAAVKANGVRAVGVPVDDHGMRSEMLDRIRAQGVLVTPAHQFPTGGVLPPHRRTQMAQWAIRHGGFVIEDDYDAEYRYDRQPIGALQGLAPDHVIYIGSASKILAPALRLGWLAAPSCLVEEIARRKRHADLGSPLLEQAAYAEFLREGGLDRHLRRMRAIYRRRRDALIDALRHRLPGWRPVGEAAGLHLVAILPPHLDEAEVARRAATRSIRLYPMRDFSDRHPREPALVFGFGCVDETEIELAISELANALAS